ncbi:MAG TPA: asparagine synthase (glutamine-hydrolyzing) [Verrucomicrobiae bacterium]|nr:asparagine synthase (glutamine-hydrolyzing) [Verrucomicrobiae bacterium]
MCGIAGKFNFADNAPVSRELIARMNVAQAHRGPDGSGEYFDRGVGLAHRRLSILDVAGGHQPMANEDDTIWIVFNGEIYNFPELRDRLEAKGHTFRSHCDTEAIVHLYEDLGENCVDELRGMFAFAIWDSRIEKLFIARDRIGIKPLHYAVLGGKSLVFGSEMKAILQDDAVPRRVNLEALSEYVSLLYVPDPRTMFEGIEKLPPAHTLTCDRNGVRIRQYWDVRYDVNGSLTEEQAAGQLFDLLKGAVKDHLLSDVPLGAFLSGGVDSSTIVGLMREVITGKLVTSSIGFREEAYNELPYARQMAERFHSEHHEQVVHADIEHLFPLIVWSFDEPFADSSAIPTYYVSKTAREYVTVALSGDGGDELFAGYSRFRLGQLEHRLRRTLGPLRFLGALARVLPDDVRFKARNSLESITRAPDDTCARKHFLYLFTEEAKRHFMAQPETHDYAAKFRECYGKAQAAPDDWLNRALYVDLKTYLVDDILTKVDRMSMAVALETRPPLLDHKVVEFVATLPPRFKLKGFESKHILKKAASRLVPQEILSRKKQGFRLPIAEWLRDRLRATAEDLLLGRTATQRGYFKKSEIETLWRDHRSGHRDNAHQIWSLMLLELWHRKYIDDARPPTAPKKFSVNR